MRQYVLTPRADRDLDEIWDQLAVRSAANADRIVAQLERAMCQLAESPGIGHWREDLADKRHRFFLVYSYDSLP